MNATVSSADHAPSGLVVEGLPALVMLFRGRARTVSGAGEKGGE